MAKDDLLKMDGTVVESKGNGQFSVLLENGITVKAQLAGRLRKFKIRVITGDKVTVGFSPYDSERGLIVAREQLG
jgi:translation initiation factor IF-1